MTDPATRSVGATSIQCRPIVPGDRDRLVALLTRGFPDRTSDYWEKAVDRLAAYTAEGGYPHHGYVLQAGDDLVGVLLMIFSRDASDAAISRCNLSSWCVDDQYRTYAPFLVTRATRDKTITYVNISPKRSTRTTVEAQGFTRYCDGIFMGIPLLSRGSRQRVACVSGDGLPPAAACPADVALMQAHAQFHCLRFWCVTEEAAFPFVFVSQRRIRNLVETAHVIYCSDIELVGRFANPIGRYLARRGLFFLSIDATAPVEGMVGRYLADRQPKYFKGPHQPRLGDLAFSELPMFGA